jgi:hypothetical protein
MALQTVRPPVRDPREPTQHLLDPVRIGPRHIQLSLTVRRDDDGFWRGRLRFSDGTGEGGERRTAEIFCGTSEAELWMAVHHLRDHHLRDLYRSLDTTEP